MSEPKHISEVLRDLDFRALGDAVRFIEPQEKEKYQSTNPLPPISFDIQAEDWTRWNESPLTN